MIVLLTRTAMSAIAMMTNNKEKIMKIINIETPKAQMEQIVASTCGLYAYRDTLALEKIGTSEYQKNYVSYYRVRRDKNWLAAYFNFMQKQVSNPKITFEEILRQISSTPHKTKNGIRSTIDISFASKMLATLNPNYPIWDSQVAKAVGISYDQSRKEEDYIKIYEKLTENIHTFLQTNNGTKCIEEFDKTFPNFTDINPVKKVDLYLWKMEK